jgi:hypothetical protein
LDTIKSENEINLLIAVKRLMAAIDAVMEACSPESAMANATATFAEHDAAETELRALLKRIEREGS